MKRPGLKKASKRVTLHHKHKVEAKVREHNRKLRKSIKKGSPLNKGSRFSKRTRDPGVPSNCPFRDEILQEAQQWAINNEKEKEEMKIKQREWQKKCRNAKSMGFSNVQQMMDDSAKKKEEYERQQREKIVELEKEVNSGQVKGVRESQNFWRQVNSVIDEADVILCVLDARDPEGSRCKKIEEAVMDRDDKKMVFILNKIDLIPREAAKAWLIHYRRIGFATLCFRATTQQQRSNLTQKNSSGTLDDLESGTKAMLNYIANYGRKESADGTSKIRTAVTVGVVGKPNVGKSSIINTLKRNKSCSVGGKPGVTRSLQTVKVDTNVKLIDTPGVVLKQESEASVVGTILLNAAVGGVEDARAAACEIVRRCGDMEKLAFHYQLEFGNDILKDKPENFLAALAKRKGKLKKGGRPDVNSAAKFLVREWTCGNLSFHTMPPQTETKEDKITTGGISEMDLDNMMMGSDEMDGMDDSSNKPNLLFKKVSEPESIQHVVNIQQSGSRKRKPLVSESMDDDEEEIDAEKKRLEDLKHLGVPDNHGRDLSNAQCDSDLKKLQKKRKKALKKSRMEMDSVGDDLTKMMGGGDDYDFSTDYNN